MVLSSTSGSARAISRTTSKSIVFFAIIVPEDILALVRTVHDVIHDLRDMENPYQHTPEVSIVTLVRGINPQSRGNTLEPEPHVFIHRVPRYAAHHACSFQMKTGPHDVDLPFLRSDEGVQLGCVSAQEEKAVEVAAMNIEEDGIE
jgi:hypothetical protein